MKPFPLVLSAVLLVGVALAANAAPSVVKAPSSPAQVDAIVDAAVDKLWAQTDEYWHDGDYPRIIALDRIITQADPQFVESYSTGGWLMESTGKTRDAEAFYQESARNNPQKSYAWHSLGMFYFNTVKDYGAAARAFETGTRQRDAEINDWKMLAHTYEKMQKVDKAAMTWRTIKARWPNGPAVDVNLQRALAAQKAAQASPRNGQ